MLEGIHKKLGIISSYSDDTGMPVYTEPNDLVSIGLDLFERPQKMAKYAAQGWHSMRQAAIEDKISLLVVSAFRSIDYQASLIQSKLDKGHSIKNILMVNAAPGHSEHHTGRALDLATPGCEPLCDAFEQTDAFHWLTENAHKYGFTLSYPKENKWGIGYEPWHWCYSRIE